MAETMELAWELARRHPRAAARTLEELPAAAAAAFLAETPIELATETLSRMTSPAASRVVKALEPAAAAPLLRAAASNVSAAILRQLGESRRAEILGLLPRKSAGACRMLLRYAEDTVGAWMEPRAAVLPDDVTIDSAIRRLRQSGERKNARIYVVDRDRRLRGILHVWDLLNTDRDVRVSSVMRRRRRTLAAHTQLTAVLDHPGWSEADDLPIIGADGSFLGILRHVDLVWAVRTRFPNAQSAGFDDVALELTTNVWQGMSQFLETIAAIATPPAGEREEEQR